MGDSPRESNGGQTTEAAAATPGAAFLSFARRTSLWGDPRLDCPPTTWLPQPSLLLAQVARRPRPRWSRPSPTRRISSSSEARGTPECPRSDLSSRQWGRVGGWAGRVGGVGGWWEGWGGSWGGRVNDQSAGQEAGRPGVPRLWRAEPHEQAALHARVCSFPPSPLIAGCPPGSGEEDLRKVPAPTLARPCTRRRAPPRAVARVSAGVSGVQRRGGPPHLEEPRLVIIADPWLSAGLRGAWRGGGGLHHEGREPQRHGLRIRPLPHSGERTEGAQ